MKINRISKVLLYIICGLLILLTISILIISPITKHLLEKYDEQYSGRKITLDRAYVNPLTGYIYLDEVRIFEYESDSIFISADGISANFSLLKLLKGTYEISDLSLDRPHGTIIRQSDTLNFQDLITLFSVKPEADTSKEKVHFNLLNFKISDGEFVFQDSTVPINYSINKVNIESTGIRWNVDTVNILYSFLGGKNKGGIKGDITINLNNLDYHFSALVNEFDLEIIGQYLQEFMTYGTFKASLDANIQAKGNFNDQENIKARGSMSINEFHFGANLADDYVSFKKLSVVINDLSPKDHIYDFDTVALLQPYFRYEKYDSLDNIETVFGKDGTNINQVNSNPAHFNLILELAKYVRVLAKNFFYSDYKVNRFEVNMAQLKFNDYSLGETFSIACNPLNISSDSINKNSKEVIVNLNAELKPYGSIEMALNINPQDSGNFDLKYNLEQLPAAMFNPYLISYTSYPMDRGTIELKGNWNVRDGNIQSKNNLLIIDARTTNRLKNKDSSWLPMWLVMAFVRDRGNVIDYEIPITGNLKDPKFNIGDIITDVLTNIFVKPATTGYRLQVKNTETEIEKSLTLKWALRNSTPTKGQEKFIEKMADFLSENQVASITVSPQYYSSKEKEYILLFEAKKKYYQTYKQVSSIAFSKSDSQSVDKMSIKDPAFLSYLDNQVKDSLLFSVQDKCLRIIDQNTIENIFNSLNLERKKKFLDYFEENKTKNRVVFATAEGKIPYDGFSMYKIEYKGDFPESLIEAYREMMELNNENPRKKFKDERKSEKYILSVN